MRSYVVNTRLISFFCSSSTTVVTQHAQQNRRLRRSHGGTRRGHSHATTRHTTEGTQAQIVSFTKNVSRMALKARVISNFKGEHPSTHQPHGRENRQQREHRRAADT
jgi:hypothetical protein